jgi:hypothetical protein
VQLFNALTEESEKEKNHLMDSVKKSKIWGQLLQDLELEYAKSKMTEAHQIVLFRMGGFKERTWTLLRDALKDAYGIQFLSCSRLREV